MYRNITYNFFVLIWATSKAGYINKGWKKQEAICLHKSAQKILKKIALTGVQI